MGYKTRKGRKKLAKKTLRKRRNKLGKRTRRGGVKFGNPIRYLYNRFSRRQRPPASTGVVPGGIAAAEAAAPQAPDGTAADDALQAAQGEEPPPDGTAAPPLEERAQPLYEHSGLPDGSGTSSSLYEPSGRSILQRARESGLNPFRGRAVDRFAQDATCPYGDEYAYSLGTIGSVEKGLGGRGLSKNLINSFFVISNNILIPNEQ